MGKGLRRRKGGGEDGVVERGVVVRFRGRVEEGEERGGEEAEEGVWLIGPVQAARAPGVAPRQRVLRPVVVTRRRIYSSSRRRRRRFLLVLVLELGGRGSDGIGGHGEGCGGRRGEEIPCSSSSSSSRCCEGGKGEGDAGGSTGEGEG